MKRASKEMKEHRGNSLDTEETPNPAKEEEIKLYFLS